MKPLYPLSLAILLLFCHCSKQYNLSITCPPSQTIEIYDDPYVVIEQEFPAPIVTTDCEINKYWYSLGDYPVVGLGKNTLNYLATDACGNTATCMVEVNTVDFRDKWVGTYTGFRDCSALNVPQDHPDQNMTVTITKGPNTFELKVQDDIVPVGLNGKSAFAPLNGYFMYFMGFKSDTLYVYQQWGTANANETCNFVGKKN
jgi:hypothetical protein